MARYHAQTEMEFMSLSSCCRFSFFGYISTYSDGLSFVKFMLLVARKECDEAIVHFCISKNGSPELSFQLKNVSSALDFVVFGAIRIVCRQELLNLCIVETGDRALVENNYYFANWQPTPTNSRYALQNDCVGIFFTLRRMQWRRMTNTNCKLLAVIVNENKMTCRTISQALWVRFKSYDCPIIRRHLLQNLCSSRFLAPNSNHSGFRLNKHRNSGANSLMRLFAQKHISAHLPPRMSRSHIQLKHSDEMRRIKSNRFFSRISNIHPSRFNDNDEMIKQWDRN